MATENVKGILIPEGSWGVCLWELGEHEYLCDDGRYLSLEGLMGDIKVEEKMRKAAHYWLQEAKGRPVWVRGARKVTDDEFDDQMERLKDGKIPDPVDQVRQALRKKG